MQYASDGRVSVLTTRIADFLIWMPVLRARLAQE